MNYKKTLQPVNHTVEELKLITKMYNENHKGISFKVAQSVKNQLVAEELVAEIFCKASQKIRLFDENSGAISTWLYTLANNVIIDYFRSSTCNNNYNTTNVESFMNDDEKNTFDFVAPTSTLADSKVNNAEILNKVDLAISNLDLKYQKIAILYFKFEYSYNEIQSILNLPLGSVKAMLFRARTMLQTELKVAKTA